MRIAEKDFGRTQKDRLAEMEKWAKIVNRVKHRLSFGIVPANNHYAGFGPATTNTFRKMTGLEPVVWEEMKQAR